MAEKRRLTPGAYWQLRALARDREVLQRDVERASGALRATLASLDAHAQAIDVDLRQAWHWDDETCTIWADDDG